MAELNSREFKKHSRGLALVAIFSLVAVATIAGGCGSKSGTQPGA